MAWAGACAGHQDQAEIIVGFTVGGVEAQDLAKLFLRQVEFFLSDVYVPEIVMSPEGIGIERQRMLQCFQGVVVVLLAAVNDSKQVVTLDAGGVQSSAALLFSVWLPPPNLGATGLRLPGMAMGHFEVGRGLLRVVADCCATDLPAEMKTTVSARIRNSSRARPAFLGGC